MTNYYIKLPKNDDKLSFCTGRVVIWVGMRYGEGVIESYKI